MVSSDRTSPRYQVDLIRPAEICSVKANDSSWVGE